MTSKKENRSSFGFIRCADSAQDDIKNENRRSFDFVRCADFAQDDIKKNEKCRSFDSCGAKRATLRSG
jgi:hypothetical protein